MPAPSGRDPLPTSPNLSPRRALITGITGQDGSYLAEFLLEQDYEVHGMVRRASTENFARIDHLRERVQLHQADLLDQLSIVDLIRKVRPKEVYNLAAQTFVPTSWNQPLLTGEFTALRVTRLLEAIRLVDRAIRVYPACRREHADPVRDDRPTDRSRYDPTL